MWWCELAVHVNTCAELAISLTEHLRRMEGYQWVWGLCQWQKTDCPREVPPTDDLCQQDSGLLPCLTIQTVFEDLYWQLLPSYYSDAHMLSTSIWKGLCFGPTIQEFQTMVTWFLCFWACSKVHYCDGEQNWASHGGWEQERKRWPQVPLLGGAPSDFCPTVSLCHLSVAPQTVDQAFRAWAFGDIPYLKHGSHSPLSFSRILNSLFLILTVMLLFQS